MLSLVRSLDTMLGAILPEKPYTSVRLNWTDDDMGPSVGCNADMEEQFHIVFGPWLRSDYHRQLEEMLEGIVKRANAGEEEYGWVMCSTVRMKLSIYKVYKAKHRTMLSIDTIFIRPCLQGSRILGKILVYFASNTNLNVGIGISKCYPASRDAMDKFYGGCNPKIFSRVEGYEHRSSDPCYSYTLLHVLDGENETYGPSKRLLLELIGEVNQEYPNAEALNGRRMDDISEVEWNWNTLALINYKYDLQLDIVKFYFNKGTNWLDQKMKNLFFECSYERLKRIENPSEEVTNIIKWLHGDPAILATDDIFTVDRAVLREYKVLIAEMDRNYLFSSCGMFIKFWNFNRVYLKEINRTKYLDDAVKILSFQELPNMSMSPNVITHLRLQKGEQTDFVSYDKQQYPIKRYLDETMKSTRNPTLKYFFERCYTSMSFRIDANQQKIHFITPTEKETDRLEFLRICPDLIEKIRILSADN